MTNKSWTVIIDEDSEGNSILPFPDEMIKELGWLEGDDLDFETKDGEIVIINRSLEKRNQDK